MDFAQIWGGDESGHRLVDAARAGNWPAMLKMLTEQGELINATRPGDDGHYAVLHHAAESGAPVSVVKELLRRGAWRTLRSARGERPVDIAERAGHRHLVGLLQPVLQRSVALDELRLIQEHFHGVINERAARHVRKHALRLPDLEPLLEVDELWFTVPGMYGGFKFWLERIADDAVLVAESWCRVVGGSGQRHVVSANGSLLVAEGFD